eukprot:jgi/Mesvir1/23557/Mv18254-RA.1
MSRPMATEYCLAIDIGGTKIATAVVSSDGRLFGTTKSPTPSTRDSEELFSFVLRLAQDALEQSSKELGISTSAAIRHCGVGCPGPMDRGGILVSPNMLPAWRRFPLRARLSEALGLHTVVDNDGHALALGEGWHGATRGCQNYMVATVSTGVGAGIVLNGRLLQGDAGNAGHFGHIVLDPSVGVIEAMCSGTGIRNVTGRDAAQASRDLIEQCGTHIGQAAACVVNLLDLHLVAFGGSVAQGFGEPFFTAAQREVDHWTRHLDFARGAKVVPCMLGAKGALLGAAALAFTAAGMIDLGGLTTVGQMSGVNQAMSGVNQAHAENNSAAVSDGHSSAPLLSAADTANRDDNADDNAIKGGNANACTVPTSTAPQRPSRQRLILMKGHPGCGKSTLALMLASRLRCPLVDKDDVRDMFGPIEDALGGRQPVGAVGLLNDVAYDVLWRTVERQLMAGLGAIVDSPMARVELFEQAKALAGRYNAELLVIECQVSDQGTWAARLEERRRKQEAEASSQPPGWSAHKPTTWAHVESILNRYAGCYNYDMGGVRKLCIDTTGITPDQACERALDWISGGGRQG